MHSFTTRPINNINSHGDRTTGVSMVMRFLTADVTKTWRARHLGWCRHWAAHLCKQAPAGCL